MHFFDLAEPIYQLDEFKLKTPADISRREF